MSKGNTIESVVDAVEEGISEVELNVAVDSVGLGGNCGQQHWLSKFNLVSGLPNSEGEMELDAAIMEGELMNAGAVASLKGYPEPIRLNDG